MLISKSKFVAGVQCLKRLYLIVHEPELAARPDESGQAIIDQGQEVGLLAQQMSPCGVAVESRDRVQAIRATRELIENPEIPAIFEGCAAKTSYTCRMNDLAKSCIRIFPLNSCHDRVAPTFPRLVGQRFPFPGGPRPREPRSPSAIAGSARTTTSPSIDCPAQTVLGCVENVLVRVDQASHLGHS